MALPRSKYVQEGSIGVYHCFCRCVRRAFLCGFDKHSGRDFSHRKAWIEDRLRLLSSIFAIDVFSYSVVENHYHSILRTRPDIVDSWSNHEVARRWLTLCPIRYRSKNKPPPSFEQQISSLADCPKRIAQLRNRLCSLSWFMKHINEFIARAANKEDDVKGRFWESRFKSQTLLDQPAIAACMVYVDLNPIRARLATTPENSDFTSIQQRIRNWQSVSLSTTAVDNNWLCPINPQSGRQGILYMSNENYFELVDRSGRIVRSDKQGSIPDDLSPILLRLGARPESWIDTVSHFGNSFGLVAGLASNMHNLAGQLGKKWFVGVTAARTAFV